MEKIMNKLILPLLLATAAFATPASANWFHNPYQGINRNIGSAPNPTPADIQEMRLPQVTKVEIPMLNYTVVEPAKDPNKTASAGTPVNTPAQSGSANTVAAASPSR
jgi:hypothetical protein